MSSRIGGGGNRGGSGASSGAGGSGTGGGGGDSRKRPTYLGGNSTPPAPSASPASSSGSSRQGGRPRQQPAASSSAAAANGQNAGDAAPASALSALTTIQNLVAAHPAAILVSSTQKDNPALACVKNVPCVLVDRSKMTADYVLNANTCAVYIQLAFHCYKRDYLIQRITKIGKEYRLRLIICEADAKSDDNVKALEDINVMALLNDFVLIVAWSREEVARYLETFKVYENKSAASIQERVEHDYLSQLTKVMTAVPSVNKTDVLTLSSTFGSLKAMCAASMEDLALCPGVGEKKVLRLYEALHVPFSGGGGGGGRKSGSVAEKKRKPRGGKRAGGKTKKVSDGEEEENDEEDVNDSDETKDEGADDGEKGDDESQEKQFLARWCEKAEDVEGLEEAFPDWKDNITFIWNQDVAEIRRAGKFLQENLTESQKDLDEDEGGEDEEEGGTMRDGDGQPDAVANRRKKITKVTALQFFIDLMEELLELREGNADA